MRTGDFINTLQRSRGNFPQSGIFIDKTQYIPSIFYSNEFPILFTRPRRFGKTFTLTMLKAFFQPTYQIKNRRILPKFGPNENTKYFKGSSQRPSQNKDSFEQLNIGNRQSSSFFNEYHGNIPILHISFRNVKGNTIKQLKKNIQKKISDIYSEHIYIIVSILLKQIEFKKKQFEDVKETIQNICDSQNNSKQAVKLLYNQFLVNKKVKSLIDANKMIRKFCLIQQGQEDFEGELDDSLLNLVLLLYSFYQQKPVFVLVDQYDAAVLKLVIQFINQDDKRNTITKEFIEKAAQILTNILDPIAKDIGKYVQHCLLAGVIEIVLKQGESGLNTIKVNSLASEEFIDLFGFTQQEIKRSVKEIIKKKKFTPKMQMQKQMFRQMKEFYNGYSSSESLLQSLERGQLLLRSHELKKANLSLNARLLGNEWNQYFAAFSQDESLNIRKNIMPNSLKSDFILKTTVDALQKMGIYQFYS